MASQEFESSIEETKPIADMDPAEMAVKLREMGDEETADEITSAEEATAFEGLFGQGPRKPYLYRSHQVGYFPLREPGSAAPISISAVGIVDPDPNLLNSRIDIHLDRLYIEEYPGSLFGAGEHHILVNFKASNQLPEAATPETVAFSQTYVAFDGDEAGVIGYPVFIGINVGDAGASFEIETVNIKNSEDEAVLKMLDSDEFKGGLSLLNTAQPAIAPLTKLATGTTKMLASRSKNVTVQKQYIGLDTTLAAAGAPLVAGNFIMAQVPGPAEINWSEYQFDPNTGTVMSTANGGQPLRYNYLIFRVTPHN